MAQDPTLDRLLPRPLRQCPVVMDSLARRGETPSSRVRRRPRRSRRCITMDLSHRRNRWGSSRGLRHSNLGCFPPQTSRVPSCCRLRSVRSWHWYWLAAAWCGFGGSSDVTATSAVAPSSEPAAAVSTTTEPKATLPADARACGSTDAFDVYTATDVTSCAFSESVADAVGSPRGGATGYLVDAYSFVTGRSYSMNCTEKTNGETRCTGGNNAVVVLIER